MNLIHRGRAKVSVSVTCLVLVKMHGDNRKKLFVKIIGNNDVRMDEFPSFSFPFLRIVFISWCSVLLVSLLLHYFVIGLVKFLLGSVVVR
jgi:hypothetical protein